MDEKTTLNILFVTTECLPFCANGGMAEMAYRSEERRVGKEC